MYLVHKSLQRDQKLNNTIDRPLFKVKNKMSFKKTLQHICTPGLTASS